MRLWSKLFGNVLYFAGCMQRFVLQELRQNYLKLLMLSKLEPIQVDEACCGAPALHAGYFKQFKRLARLNLRLFEEHSVKKVITACPACYKIFKLEYPKYFQSKVNVEHVSQVLWKMVQAGKLKLCNLRLSATYHDPCQLGRYCNVYEEPRQLLMAAGLRLKEMQFNRQYAQCCGGGGGVKANYPELASRLAEQRVIQALKTGAKALVTSCPMCYFCLREAARNKIEVLEFSQVLNRACKSL